MTSASVTAWMNNRELRQRRRDVNENGMLVHQVFVHFFAFTTRLQLSRFVEDVNTYGNDFLLLSLNFDTRAIYMRKNKTRLT